MKLGSLGAAFLLALSLGGGVADAAVVHDDAATDFTGEYRGVGQLDVTFTSVGGSSAISFDLFGARSVDGFGNGFDDVFDIIVNGVTVFSGLFNMSGGGISTVATNTESWAWSTVTNPGGFFEGGVTSVSGLVTLIAGANTFSVVFSSPDASNSGNQGVGDESWALNNLDIAAVPLPAALPLILLGLGGLAGLSLRRRLRR